MNADFAVDSSPAVRSILSLLKHCLTGYKFNSKYRYVKPQSWNVTHLWLVDWFLWLNKESECQGKKREKKCISLHADRFARRGSAANRKKQNSETALGQIVLIGYEGVKYCMVARANSYATTQRQAKSQPATSTTFWLLQLISVNFYLRLKEFSKTFRVHLMPVYSLISLCPLETLILVFILQTWL